MLVNRSLCLIRRQVHTSTNAVVYMPKADIYRFGDASRPVFRAVEWTVNENENWAVISSTSHEKHQFFQALLGHLRISPSPPPPGGLFPFIYPQDSRDHISIVSFGNRRRASRGAFYDYSARYGAVLEEDRITLRQYMFPETIDPYGGTPEELRDPSWAHDIDGLVRLSPERHALFESLVQKTGLADLLDLPLIALSNGQTRRARILKAIWAQPQLLLLDEPLAGLDAQNRPNVLNLLHELHAAKSPRVILGLRTQDAIPEWITHVALLHGSSVKTGPKDQILAAEPAKATSDCSSCTPTCMSPIGRIIVDMKNVKVQYEDRKILQNLTWQIREGERWHLQGENGSGKTTLLSVLTGEHPQSYTQRTHLQLFGRSRQQMATPQLQSLIGVLSPEIFDAFPRRAGMSVWEVVGTGFDGTYVPRGKHAVGAGVMSALTEKDIMSRVTRCTEVIAALGPAAWGHKMNAAEFEKRDFVDLSVGEQSMVLLMRALVGRPQLVLLDEVWSGMDECMVDAAKRYLTQGGVNSQQAVVLITHWDDQVPWRVQDGLKRIRLENGTPVFL